MATTLVKAAVLLLLGGLASDITVAAVATHVQSTTNGFDHVGCYSDAIANRALIGNTLVNYNTMTVEVCAGFCAGSSIFGVEYGGECYCGNTLQGGSVSEDIGGCNMLCDGNQNEYCGGSNRLDLYTVGGATPTIGAAPSHVAKAGNFTWTACYTDAIANRALVGNTLVNYNTMTVEICAAFCASYTYFGVEYSGECYCGNTIQGGNAAAGTGDCNMLCDGNRLEYCGGSNRLDLYTNGGATTVTPVVPAGPTHVPTAGGFTWTSCYTDAIANRALTGKTLVNYNTMTVEICAAFCTSYTYFGVEYSGECYCGNTIQGGSVSAGAGDCNMLCDGNQNEYCGGPNRLDLYTANGTTSTTTGTSTTTTTAAGGPTHVAKAGNYTWKGCYTDGINNRALTSDALVNYQTMTVEICATYCSQYSMFGLEFSGECYCGNGIQGGNTNATTSDCNMLCDGNQNEYCGGANRLDVYNGTATPTAVGSSPVNDLPTGWVYDGCWIDNINARIMGGVQPDNQDLTVESCISTCIGLGFSVAGLEFAYQCFCANAVINNGARSPKANDCSSPCTGNVTEMCGGPSRMSIYNTGTLSVLGPPAPQTGNISNWAYKGCRTDDVDDRTLFWDIILPNNNTATNCLNLCAEYGYNAAGMEYADECHCGDISYVEAGTSVIGLETDCNSICSGNSSEICGGANRLSYYEWTGTPLYTWHTPTGTGAGEYQFLIGGLVVPLITTVGINGKVTFLEKNGNSVTPNSTGVYELDLSQINNFTAAWRTMHVASNIFCSASITLPDRGGRQINVGGWANNWGFESDVYGVRLYTPDGSAGVPGTNDWQEDYNEIRLQTARWYPSAMVMSNGSLLVIGGEVGAGAAASPSLELLPPVGGLVNFDWLARTDPFNLYPFIIVLPSGNIFVVYYNEARVLEPVNFNTIKTLTNVPGSVDTFLAGRTYPYSGTMVLLPQYAPYHDPLTILICGGSSGSGLALDNCVTTNPDDAVPTWNIERMPSQRVMSCMAALPDGTFLILNGAHQGQAGFAVASSPNLQAVLYDPSQPLGSRMSIMATTIVARLYHSEAILLPDGRVLVSGSDPEDNFHPQEFRIEVFVPPYLLSGAPRPSFTIANNDWAYKQVVTIQIQLPSGNANNAKVSLLGSPSSTHGNSMGQRTIFPACSCTTSSCTITAPPDSHTSPPGWFLLFLLDGPTPSNGTWVRIGGDPAEVGSWPDLKDFVVPGVGPVAQ